MDVKKTLQNGFSEVYASLLMNGFPQQWQSVLSHRIHVR